MDFKDIKKIMRFIKGLTHYGFLNLKHATNTIKKENLPVLLQENYDAISLLGFLYKEDYITYDEVEQKFKLDVYKLTSTIIEGATITGGKIQTQDPTGGDGTQQAIVIDGSTNRLEFYVDDDTNPVIEMDDNIVGSAPGIWIDDGALYVAKTMEDFTDIRSNYTEITSTKDGKIFHVFNNGDSANDTYGIYSEVYNGGAGKSWAGYFDGGDVNIQNSLHFNETEAINSSRDATFNSLDIDSTGASIDSSGDAILNSITNNGYEKKNVITTSSDPYFCTSSDNIVLVNPPGSAISIILPAPSSGRQLTIKDENGTASTNNITIDQNASEDIDGSASYIINTDYGSVTLVSDGTDWYITSEV